MAVVPSNSDVLSRVRREQRLRGKSSMSSGLRIVLAATGITLAILLFAFGAVGMLMMARSPQEPIASKLDLAPPLNAQAEVDPNQPLPETVVAKELPAKTEPESKMVKTLRVIPPPAETPNDAVAQQKQLPVADPETTAAIPPPAAKQPQVPQPVAQQQPRHQQQAVRRPGPKKDSQADNPLYQLFGIKQYR
jgi:hypothetical protein